MNRLEELIEGLCPDGVEYCAIESVSKVLSPKIKIKTHDFLDCGKYPVIDQSQDYIGGYTDEDGAFQNGEYIIFGDHTCVVKYVDFPFLQGADGVKVIQAKGSVLSKYLYYAMSNVKLEAGYMRHWSKMRANLIPAPPLEVQREIVRILDNFTELTAELTAELAARKQQYEYYRDKLLSFNCRGKTSDITWQSLGAVCEFVRGPFGGSLKKEYFVQDGVAVYEQQHAIHNQFNFRYFITDEKYNELKRFEVFPGDLIMSCSGTMGRIAIIPHNAPKGIINQALLKITVKPELNNKFLKYYFEAVISKQFNETARGGAIKNVASVSELKAVKIPVPPIDIQKHIVRVLDNFESICSDLNIGLPAEINARQKQYEYYRDKLLTFKEQTA